MERFHATHQDVSVELNVTRHPYSFVGDKPIAKGAELKETWADALYRYMGSTGDFAQKTQTASRMLDELGAAAGIAFDIRVKGAHDRENFYVDSQRLVLWAGHFGKQEELMSELNALHFSRAQSAGERATLVKAAETVGLDAAETAAFLDGDELADAVWESYKSTSTLREPQTLTLTWARRLCYIPLPRILTCTCAPPSSSCRSSRGEADPLDPALRLQRAVDLRGGRPLPRAGAQRGLRGARQRQRRALHGAPRADAARQPRRQAHARRQGRALQAGRVVARADRGRGGGGRHVHGQGVERTEWTFSHGETTADRDEPRVNPSHWVRGARGFEFLAGVALCE